MQEEQVPEYRLTNGYDRRPNGVSALFNWVVNDPKFHFSQFP